MIVAGSPRDDLARLASLVLGARRLVAGGALVDLSAIEERVTDVCRAVAALPREEGQSLIEELQSLISKLDRLGEDLQDRLEQITGRSGDS